MNPQHIALTDALTRAANYIDALGGDSKPYRSALAAPASQSAVSQQAGDEAQVLSQAARDVLAERQRQVNVEGWTPEHDDDEHNGGPALARAAACYLLFSDAYPNAGQPPPQWPWDAGWWKPKDYRRDVVRAAALALAEIERLDRAARQSTPQGGKHD